MHLCMAYGWLNDDYIFIHVRIYAKIVVYGNQQVTNIPQYSLNRQNLNIYDALMVYH